MLREFSSVKKKIWFLNEERMGKMKVVRRDFYKKNLRISPIPKIYIKGEYINLIIDISLINEL